MPTLERDELLAQLGGHVERARTGSETFVFLDGEGGASKTTVARALFAETPKSALLLSGQCDPLTTPRPLGPLLLIAADPESGLTDTRVDPPGRDKQRPSCRQHLRGNRAQPLLLRGS